MAINVFPGYDLTIDSDGNLHNMYRDVDLGFGGWVYSNPGMYGRAITFDVASLHPNSMKQLNYYGEFQQNFNDLLSARLFIKHGDFESAKKLFDGKLTPYLNDPKQAKQLSKALKIAINSCYGLTSSSYDVPFVDKRNVNNIVALRGALFMKTLLDEVVARGFKVIHIKTDSIKILEPTDDIQKFVMDFGKKYGYTFEIEHTWEKLCLIDNAQYIGKHGPDDPESPGEWEAVGDKFQVPYIFKVLFTRTPIEFDDLCETKAVSTALYLDMNEGLSGEHHYHFVGKVGQFCPVVSGAGGGILLRKGDGEKYYAAEGTKKKSFKKGEEEAYRWLESEDVKNKGLEPYIDRSYYDVQVDDAITTLNKFGDAEWFMESSN